MTSFLSDEPPPSHSLSHLPPTIVTRRTSLAINQPLGRRAPPATNHPSGHCSPVSHLPLAKPQHLRQDVYRWRHKISAIVYDT
ncbi:hypothetical protein AKJ16_DCAP01437 [Drosera capensis]